MGTKNPARPPMAADPNATRTSGVDCPAIANAIAPTTLATKVRPRAATMMRPPHTTIRLAVPYGELGMWMYHCQIPEHAERGMMGDLMVGE